MKESLAIQTLMLALCCGTAVSVLAQTAEKKEEICFESRKGASEITKRDIQPGLPNVKCSPTTGAALWYGDPYEGTVPMGKMPLLDNIPEGHAVVKPRTEKLALYAQCGVACHNGTVPKGYPTSKQPVPIPTMEAMVPDVKNLQHGRGRIWCLDCHHATKRNMFVDNFGDPVSMDQPQLLCGKCHGDKLRDWRDGIHGKRIGEFASTGKKRWFTCPECHNPHNVQDGDRDKGFLQLQPEPPPQLPKGMKDAKYEQTSPIAH
jgi:Zn finger protein HypA/HybF involved in hydrogenase expression